ncbi:MAG: phytanoyl-CoA dioxygenase family protein [Fimbriiglobus sp.]
MTPADRARLDADGFVLLRGVISVAALDSARFDVASALAAAAGDPAVLGDAGQPPAGARDLLRLWPGVLDLARSPPLAGPLLAALGPSAGVVRGLYFDKPPGHGWALPWHRDKAIAVKQHGPLGRFRGATVKAGVPHVEPPPEVLDGMLTARVHLDPMGLANGPLKLIPGSHRDDAAADGRAAITLACEAGDVLLIRPRVMHASAGCPPGHAGHRRIVHVECAALPTLSDGYQWHDFWPLTADGVGSTSAGRC